MPRPNSWRKYQIRCATLEAPDRGSERPASIYEASFETRTQVHPDDTSTIGGTVFDFDNEIVNAAAYRRENSNAAGAVNNGLPSHSERQTTGFLGELSNAATWIESQIGKHSYSLDVYSAADALFGISGEVMTECIPTVSCLEQICGCERFGKAWTFAG